MIVLSLFDGISVGMQALKNKGFIIDKYYASEVDKQAIKISQLNHPEILRIGDVTKVSILRTGVIRSENGQFQIGDCEYRAPIDLVLAGSPCQGFSYSGKQLNFDDPRSKLFFEFVRILNEIKEYQGYYPEFILENVRMKPEHEDVITEHLKVWPVKINSRAFTAQNRLRYYWSSLLPTTIYGEKDLLSSEHSPKLEDILEHQDYAGVWTWPRGYNKGGTRLVDKMPCITASSWQHNFLVEQKDGTRRKFTPIECERAQGLPDNYTAPASDNQRYKVLGNGWTCPVIEYILDNLQLDLENQLDVEFVEIYDLPTNHEVTAHEHKQPYEDYGLRLQ